jgi:hypothetical protein
MRRYFESLRPADVSAIHSVPDGIFLVPGGSGPVSLAQPQAQLRDPLCRTQAQASDRVFHDRPPVLHRQGYEEAELVPYFKLYKTQIPVVEEAIETAALLLGTDKSR